MKNIKCRVCKKQFEVHNYREKIAKYCSKKCMGNDKNANWNKTGFKDGHIAYNKGAYTSRVRYKSLHKIWSNEVRDRDNWTCQRCGVKKSNAISHHIKEWENYPSKRFDVKNGITLCRTCHFSVHKMKIKPSL